MSMADYFLAVDVETANPDLCSICQVGVVGFVNGNVGHVWKSLVNPEDYFCPTNVAIHGITEADVEGAPTYRSVHLELQRRLAGQVVACHTSFDRLALIRASERAGVDSIDCRWLDTARVVRRAWKQFSRSGYALAAIANELGISFRPHDAAEDARAAGEVLLRAVAATGLTVEDWTTEALRRISSARVRIDGDSEGVLAGEVLVFTGALTIPRREAAAKAAKAGCTVDPNVTKETTLLVVGDQDIRRLAGHEKSARHRKAERLIAAGQSIRILGESDFRRLVEST